MIGGAMQHIDEVQLQAYIDGELSPDARHIVEQHILECEECCAKLDDTQCLCHSLRALVPDDDLFRSEGEFWACLAARLKPEHPSPSPWLISFPPILLGSLGLILNVVISITLALHALIGLGITGSPSAALTLWATRAMAAPGLDSLFAALGWSPAAFTTTVASAWSILGAAGQDLLFFALVVMLVGAILGTVLTMFFSWIFFIQRREAR